MMLEEDGVSVGTGSSLAPGGSASLSSTAPAAGPAGDLFLGNLFYLGEFSPLLGRNWQHLKQPNTFLYPF